MGKLTTDWFEKRGWKPYPFQQVSWELYHQKKHALIHLSTGFGKTYASCLAAIEECDPKLSGIQILYLSPLRALGNDLKKNLELPIQEMGLPLKVGSRTGDTTQNERARMKDRPPQILITTPESLNLLLTQENYRNHFESLKLIVVDEWHELMGSKRGVQVQLALSHLFKLSPNVVVRGLSATLGNPQEALDVLLGDKSGELVTGPKKREFEINCLEPEAIDSFPWAGHLGLAMVEKVCSLMDENKTTLYFTNTRSQAERWFNELTQVLEPQGKAHLVGLHHSSIEREDRERIEHGLKEGTLPYVVCTSSLDLGVDFPKVDRVFQIGSAKSISRFLQRAGRSHHNPEGIPEITFVPTHAFELFEFMALEEAMKEGLQEKINPPELCFDVLVQHLQTLALADGLDPEKAFKEISRTHCFRNLTRDNFDLAVEFLETGGCLKAYDSYQKLKPFKDRYYLANKELIRTHRMNMGTITSDPVITVQYVRGSRLGTVEENFVSKLKKGSQFIFAGRVLEYVILKDLKLMVRNAKSQNLITPVWVGGKLPLSDLLSSTLRKLLDSLSRDEFRHSLLELLHPLIKVQNQLSAFPKENELLIETCETKEGRHTFFFPFAGRLVHEGLAALMSVRLGEKAKETLSFSVNEYGLEILGPKNLIFTLEDLKKVLSLENLSVDMEKGLNKTQLAKRQFKEIAQISGLVPQNQPGKRRTLKNLQSSTSLLYDVFERYEVKNLLYRQSQSEVKLFQFQEDRMIKTLERLNKAHYHHKETGRPSPLAFPLIIERMSSTVTSGNLADRIEKLKKAYSSGQK
jgi:ATP-dependent Lhr-like helicase